MKNLLFSIYILVFNISIAQVNTKDLAIRLSSKNLSNTSFLVSWKDFGHSGNTQVYKRNVETNVAVFNPWQLIQTLTTADSLVINTSVVQEIRVVHNFFDVNNNLVNYNNGYIVIGNNIPETSFKGHLLLATTKKVIDSMLTEFVEMRDHFQGDGYITDTIIVAENASVVSVKSSIVNWYNLHPTLSNSVFLFGHVPVPYSGTMQGTETNTVAADGHNPDHNGAWVCDGYYADPDGAFTDNEQVTNPNRSQNMNAIGDLKWDQINFSSAIEIMLGRVDLSDLPALGSEITLLKRYANKLKNHKLGITVVPKKGLIEDRLGIFGAEGPARSAWMNMGSVIGETNIQEGALFPNASTNAYLFSHTVSTGSYTQYVNVANTSSFNGQFNSVFNSAFGSYHGDWDNSNNILRATIAAPGIGLTNCWNGRPHILLHQMGAGFSIGHCIRTSQNNHTEGINFVYPMLFFAGRAHVSLLGDPTLRLSMPKQVINPTATIGNNLKFVNLVWQASPSLGAVYNVYRSTSKYGKYDLIASNLTNTNFIDNTPIATTLYYQIKAKVLEKTNSASYYNESIGSILTVTGISSIQKQSITPFLSFYPNPNNGVLNLKGNFSLFTNLAITLYNLNGTLVWESKEISSAIPINLPNGMYVIQITSNNFATHRQILTLIKN